MTKEKYNFYSSEAVEEHINKLDRRVIRVLWFTLGFIFAVLLILTTILLNGK